MKHDVFRYSFTTASSYWAVCSISSNSVLDTRTHKADNGHQLRKYNSQVIPPTTHLSLESSIVKQALTIIICIITFALGLHPNTCTAASIALVQHDLGDGWTAKSPREEICPDITYVPALGSEPEHFDIRHDNREGLDGWIEKSFEVKPGTYYRFEAERKLTNVAVPRRSALVRVLWQDKNGKMVHAEVPDAQVEQLGHQPTAEPEHPTDEEAHDKSNSTVSGTYRAPPDAARAIVELHLQWAPQGEVRWSHIKFEPTTAPEERKVKLAAIHHRPIGKSPQENCEEYVPLIKQAAQAGADLIVLGETVPTANVSQAIHELAEPIPGPSTEFFAAQAKQNQTHIVVSLYERDKHLIYNTAILVGPNGQLIGKYRKVCLPHGEVEKGIAPGYEYPVFTTSIGRIGMMVCYDGFFPEVARELSNHGAEIIAWPVWGCNPKLAAARAAENHVYLVSSTFMAPKDGWMISAVFDQTGNAIAQGQEWNTIAMAEVDLSKPYIGPWNLGDFHSMINRHRPLDAKELDAQLDSMK